MTGPGGTTGNGTLASGHLLDRCRLLRHDLVLRRGGTILGIGLEHLDLNGLEDRLDGELPENQPGRMGDAQQPARKEEGADGVHPDDPPPGVLCRLRQTGTVELRSERVPWATVCVHGCGDHRRILPDRGGNGRLGNCMRDRIFRRFIDGRSGPG
jgi:hypothetical protein